MIQHESYIVSWKLLRIVAIVIRQLQLLMRINNYTHTHKKNYKLRYTTIFLDGNDYNKSEKCITIRCDICTYTLTKYIMLRIGHIKYIYK